MVISDKKKFIFIHNPKTAGESIEQALSPYASLIVSEPENLHKKLNKHSYPGQIRKFVGEKKWRSYFKFVFVRNPWERLVSLYMYARGRKRGVKARALPFKSYVPYLLKKHSRFILQTSYTAPNLVDFVGRFEQLTKHFSNICNHIGIVNELKHLNKSNHTEYRKYYDNKTRKLVHNFAKKEIELFGYTFE